MTAGTVRANKYAGKCTECGCKVDAHEGQLLRNGAGGWVVRHHPRETTWAGSPSSGRWIESGGCPASGDGVPWEDRPSRPSSRGRYGRRSSWQGFTRCTHDDYPCCGCER